MSDRVILEAFHQYLGKPSPVMQPYTGSTHFIGRMGREAVVDVYGDVVARSCLRGGDFIRAHEELKMMTNAVFTQGGFTTTVEPPNIFHGKVPPDCIEKYVNLHQRRDAIIPDILIHDHPSDRNAAGASSMEAIYDIKTLRIDKQQDILF